MERRKLEKSPEGEPCGGLNPQLVKYIAERAENISKYSDKLRQAVERISEYLAKIRKQSGVIYVSRHVIAYDEWNEPIYLAVYKGGDIGLALCYYTHDGRIAPDKEFPFEFSRDELVSTVKVLPEFIREYCEELKKNEAEIQEFSEKAERIANILSE